MGGNGGILRSTLLKLGVQWRSEHRNLLRNNCARKRSENECLEHVSSIVRSFQVGTLIDWLVQYLVESHEIEGTPSFSSVKADRVVRSKILKISKNYYYYWTSILQYYCTLTPDIFLTIYLSQVNLFPILSFYYNRENIVTFFALSTTRIWSQILYRISFLLPPVLNLNVFGVFNGRVDT